MIVFVVAYLFIRGSDVKRSGGYLKDVVDEEQVKAVREINKQKASIEKSYINQRIKSVRITTFAGGCIRSFT